MSLSPSMLTLYYSYWDSRRFLTQVHMIEEVSPAMKVGNLRKLIAQETRTNVGDLELYRIPESSPLSLEDLDTTKISLSDLGKPLFIGRSLATVFGSQAAGDHLHLVVVNVAIPFVVCCWIRGRCSDFWIMLQVSWQAKVIELLTAIREESTHLDGVSPLGLELYKFLYSEEEDIDGIIQGPGLGHLLPKNQILKTAFNDVPLSENACVVVEVVGLRDKRRPNWDAVDRAAKKTRIPPSEFDLSAFYAAQANMDERFINFRTVKKVESQDESPNDQPSLPDPNVAPIGLLYSGFGEFYETFHAETKVAGGSPDIRHQVDMFIEEMSRVYKLESLRQSTGLTHLNDILFGAGRPVIVASNIERAIADGHYVYGRFKIPCVFVEFKNEMASMAIPSIQMASYYRLSVGMVVRLNRSLISRSRLPALGITIVGPVVTFYAMAWVGSVVIQPLTPGLSCEARATDGWDRRAPRVAFVAAIDLLAWLETDAEKLSGTCSPPPIISDHFYPDITELHSFPDPQASIKFKFTSIMHTGPDRILYRAKSISPDLDLVTKVTRSYSIHLHDFCASRGHAPTICGFQKFPGNVVVIAMDYLRGDNLGKEGTEESRNKMASQLRQLVKEFHLAGYVHGDLRLPNIYRVKDKIMLLDFDWGGKVGEASYPSQTLTSILKEGRDMRNLKITKDDDERVLKITLESIGCSHSTLPN